MLADGVFDLSFHLEDEAAAISAWMDRSNDVPMSLADACLVRLSELHPKLPLVTLDADFKVYAATAGSSSRHLPGEMNLCTKQDKGIIVIPAPRMLTKNYGTAFLRALPKCPVEVV